MTRPIAVLVLSAAPAAAHVRGLARIQLKKKAEARADLLKYLELEPNGCAAKDARAILKSIS
ncbi:MAG TPA: hypothetical protein VGS00_10115 [Thermoanaerobaculia bacterium]|nr:hypothetical protein [Thermoanaerobaculia bacterium]